MDKKKIAKLGLSILPPLFVLLLCPLGMSLRQGGVVACLLLALIWWATGLIERTMTACFLLGAFLLLSGGAWETVFSFPRSENFIMIAVSFLFSQGVMNSGLAEKLLQPLLRRYTGTPLRLLLSMVIYSGIVMLFIPQSISRVILVAALFSRYFDQQHMAPALKQTLMFGLYFSSIFLGLLMIRADMVLNYGLMTVSGIFFTEAEWFSYITPPTAVFFLLSLLLYLFIFRRELATYTPPAKVVPVRQPLTARDWSRLACLLTIILLWSSEGLHGMSGTLVVCAGTAVMVPLGLLHRPDLRALNWRLLVFLTAAFSIGGMMQTSGVADILFSSLTTVLPATFSLQYAFLILLVTMALHMVLGSNVTTLSVVIPGLLAASAGVAPPVLVCFLAYIAVSGHFLIPFHHVTLLVGEGAGHITPKQTSRYGIPLTLLILFTGTILYLGWWKLRGLI